MSLNEAQAALAETLGEIRTASQAQGGQLENLETAYRSLEGSMQKVQEAQADAARIASHRAASGPESRLRYYRVADDREITRNKRAHMANEDGAIRLVGHETNGGRGYRYGLLDDPKPRTEWQLEVQKIAGLRALVRAHMDPRHRETPFLDDQLTGALQDGPEWAARIFSNSAAIGAEWIPNNLFAELEREMQHTTGVHSIFPERPLPQSGSMTLPYQEGNLRPFIGAVPTANDPANSTLTDRTTRQNSITAIKLVVATQVDRDASEDAIISVAPEIASDIARAFSFSYDDIALNGDTTGTHQDDIANWDTRSIWGTAPALGGTQDHRRAGLGLRARAFDVASTLDMGALQTAAGFRQLLGTMGAEYFSKLHTGDLKILVSPEFFLKTMLGFTELVTWDGAGAAASILTGLLGGRAGPSPGSVGFLHNVEVVMTPFLTADLAATGLFTGTGALTGAVVVDTADFEWRVRSGMTLESDLEIRNDTITTVAKTRRLFRTKANDTTADRLNVAYGFNLTS